MRPAAVILFARAKVRLIYLYCAYSIYYTPVCRRFIVMPYTNMHFGCRAPPVAVILYDEAVDVS